MPRPERNNRIPTRNRTILRNGQHQPARRIYTQQDTPQPLAPYAGNQSFCKESLLRTAEHLNDAALLYKKGIEEGKQKVQTEQGILISALFQEPAPETLLFEILSPLGFNGAQIKDIFTSLNGQPGKIFLSGEWRVIKDRELLLIEPVCSEDVSTVFSPDDPALPFRLTMEELEVTDDFIIPVTETLLASMQTN